MRDAHLKREFNGPAGVRNRHAKLSEEEVLTIRELLREGHTDKMLGKFFGVVPATIWFIRRGLTWRHLPAAGA